MLYPRWICSDCEWALFRELSKDDGILTVGFQCTYPDEAQKKMAQKQVEICSHKRKCPVGDWELYLAGQIRIHEVPMPFQDLETAT